MRILSIKTSITLKFSLLFIACLTIVILLTYQGVVKIVEEIATSYILEIIELQNNKLEELADKVEDCASVVLSNSELQILLNQAESGSVLKLSERELIGHLIETSTQQDPYLSAAQVYSPTYGYYGFNNSKLQQLEIMQLAFLDPNIKSQLSDRMLWIDTKKDGEAKPYIIGIRTIPNFIKHERPLGYFMALLDYRSIENDFKKYNLGEGSKIFLINEEGSPFLSNSDTANYGKHFLAELLQGQDGQKSGHFTRNIDGVKSLITFQTSTKTKWTSVVILPFSSITKGISTIRDIIIFIGIAAVTLIFITAELLSTSITKPIRNIQQTMKQVEKGDLSAKLPPTRIREINELSSSFNRMIVKLNLLIHEVYEGELRQQAAELKALQAHINPHFLYNTLDSFYWMLVIRGQDEVAKVVVSLSNLFRYSIGGADEAVTLKYELEHVNNYLNIQQIRFENLEVEFDIDEQIEHVRVQKLLLQPLVENAIYHGLEAKAEGKKLIIQAKQMEEHVLISIQDNGIGIEAGMLDSLRIQMKHANYSNLKRKTGTGTGIGIENVDRRIKLCYGETYGIEIDSIPAQGTVVKIRIPLNSEGGTA